VTSLRRRRAAYAAVAMIVLLGLGSAAGAALADGGGTSAGSTAAPNAVDIGFSQDMIVHHEQAVLMAQLVRARTKDPKVAALAAGIEDDQLLDIGALRGYLTLWGAPTLPAGPPMQWMAGHRGMTTMPGMATTAEINALRTSKGTTLDRMFLQLMLRHHAGGLPMLAEASEHANIPAVRALAGRMAFDQRQEMATMNGLIGALK
jgi:uncharacterized protein (DUF305 family)